VAIADRRAMARRSRQVWQLELDLSALPAMERLRRLGERRHRSRRDHGRERALQHRQHYGSRSCLGSGRKRGIHRRALGRSRGGFTSKIHCLGDARGRPIAFDLTPGEAADCKSYDTLIELPEQAPGALLADKAYDSDAIRDDLKTRRIKAVIPPKSNRKMTIRHSKRLYCQRNCIERVIGHLKINRAIATRYDQLADSFLGMLYIATARYWLKFVHAA
jgi:transposase